MQEPVHSMSALFAQLGLPSDEASIQSFVRTHSPLPRGIALQEAQFWTPAQRALLHNELRADADWAVVIDHLNVMLLDKP